MRTQSAKHIQYTLLLVSFDFTIHNLPNAIYLQNLMLKLSFKLLDARVCDVRTKTRNSFSTHFVPFYALPWIYIQRTACFSLRLLRCADSANWKKNANEVKGGGSWISNRKLYVYQIGFPELREKIPDSHSFNKSIIRMHLELVLKYISTLFCLLSLQKMCTTYLAVAMTAALFQFFWNSSTKWKHFCCIWSSITSNISLCSW